MLETRSLGGGTHIEPGLLRGGGLTQLVENYGPGWLLMGKEAKALQRFPFQQETRGRVAGGVTQGVRTAALPAFRTLDLGVEDPLSCHLFLISSSPAPFKVS